MRIPEVITTARKDAELAAEKISRLMLSTSSKVRLSDGVGLYWQFAVEIVNSTTLSVISFFMVHFV